MAFPAAFHRAVAVVLMAMGAALVMAVSVCQCDDVHWAYRPPVRPDLPTVANTSWPTNEVDLFVLHRLEAERLQPATRAALPTLIRRVSLALTGVPPSIEEVDEFLADRAPHAYEYVVDRLLASPRYGERWAQHWLDLARYADSNGYQADQLRDSWAYRDWVIKALNDNVPFDQFVIEQLAGDLLPEATIDQIIATGFHRTVTCNVEAGVPPEQNRIHQVFDRVNTTGTVLLGTTLECCQCHDHKHDPFTQRDYYGLFAFFNNTPLEVELKSGVQYDFVGPSMNVPPVGGRPQTSALVMVELNAPRETTVLVRGSYLARGEPVDPRTPAALHAFDDALPRNRLGLARWITSNENPLLPRVTVNRWWTELFGRGLVTTPEDFGTHAARPSHPQLLDWLAAEFVDSGWSMKAVHKLIVMSSTFQQAARVRPEIVQRYPENMMLARGPRYRLPAETIRDNALAIAGLLNTRMYGPPVMPYQPDGIWNASGRNQPVWESTTGEDRFRRGIYVVWKRSAPYPSFVNFDAPDRAACTVQRPRTNTPLQALTLLNDPAYAEMAMALAQRIVRESRDSTCKARAAFGFRLAVAREPKPNELRSLTSLYEQEFKKLSTRPESTSNRIGNLLPELRDEALDQTELAAWFSVASVLLNLDECVNL